MLSLIVAMTKDRVIGVNGQLPWHISDDLKRFKRLTMGKPIIMGRKTLDSIGRALPGRKNIVLTRDPDSVSIPNVEIATTFQEAYELAKEAPECFVIGGNSTYEEALPKADRLYLTLVHKYFAGDTYFPEFDLDRDFTVLEREEHAHPTDPELTYSFLIAQRKS